MKLLQPYPTTPTRVILVRHGRSTYNDQGRHQGASDESVLTAKGLQDAFQTGLALQEFSFSALYTSPLQRAQQTTAEILSALGHYRNHLCPLTIHPDLKEIDLPRWAGLPYQHVRETWPDDYHCWIERPHDFEMLPTEAGHDPQRPVQDLYDQAERFWQNILPRHAGQTILIVSHGGTIRALIGTALGLPCCHFHTLQQSNGGISILSFPKHQRPARLDVVNDTSHLGETLPKLKAGKKGLRLLLVPMFEPSHSKLQSLQTVLNSIPIAFSLSNSDQAEDLTKTLLKQSPQTVQLQVNRDDLPHLWLQTLNNRQMSNHAETKIVTGLVIAKQTLLQQMLNPIVGTDTPMDDCLSLVAGTMSIVHFPTTQTKPILQVMNFMGPNLARVGLTLCAS